jgi:bacteriorhodopsin
MILEQTGLSSDIFAKSGEGAINSMSLVIWFIYFIIWILTHVPGALPYGWNTLFKYK